jgi:hypothetical protein
MSKDKVAVEMYSTTKEYSGTSQVPNFGIQEYTGTPPAYPISVGTAPLGGTKHDGGKPDLSLIPYSAQCVEAKVFQFGAAKYERDNFKKGMESHRLVAAAMRHIGAYWEGEDLDPESGLPHLGHARCCLAMLIELERLSRLKDTRFKE